MRDYVQFSRVLRKHLALSGRSQRDLAYQLDISPATLSHWMVGKRAPSVEHVAKLAKLLGVSVDSLLKAPSSDTREGHGEEISQPDAVRAAPGKIFELRADRGWSQAGLADAAKLSLGTVSRLERGMLVRATTLHMIAKALGVAYEDIIDNRQVPESQQSKPESDFDVHFDPSFAPEEVKDLLTAFADYYRACGGAGFELDLEAQEATVTEPVHA